MNNNNIRSLLSKDKRPVIIAGPCSAETELQVLTTAKDLKARGISIFRAGIWKPRTRPGCFEGVGSVGLEWLRTVKTETGMFTAVEVASVKHVYEALKMGIDMLWVGARTSANPFSVQEIAESVKGMNIPIMIKNPVNPDPQLWLGAIERFEKCGISQPIPVLRGISVYKNSLFRNDPGWEMALELKKHRPDLLYICDPSHIAGNRDMIYALSQTAMDLNFDGLMIESHYNPDKALSDAKQQVKPEHLSQIIENLVIRHENIESVSLKNISDLRKSISHVDEQIIDLLGYRFGIVNEIALFKKSNGMTILQETRWNELMEKHIERCRLKKMNPEFILKLFSTIHQESIHQQNSIINKPEYELEISK